VAAVEKHLAKQTQRPAVSVVVGKLTSPEAQVALDAVVALPAEPVFEKVVLARDGAVLPPGTRVWVSGQAEKGELAEATRLTMESLGRTLKHIRVSEDNIVQLKAFVQPMSEVALARKEIEKYFGARPVPPIVFVEWKNPLPIEIELIAWGGRDRAGLPVEYLSTPELKPSPVYSRVARVNYGELIYISGLHASGPGTPEAEIVDVFTRLGKALEKAGSDHRHLAKATYYVTDAATTKEMGRLRPRWYDPERPPAASLAIAAGTGRAGQHVTLDMIAVPSPYVNMNSYGPAEFGYGLSEKDALEGWISLYDGQSTFGWKDGKIIERILTAGTSTVAFGPGQLKVKAYGPYKLRWGDSTITSDTANTKEAAPIQVLSGTIRSIAYRPELPLALFDGKSLDNWKRIDHPQVPKKSQATFELENGLLRVVGGPSALEYQPKKFGDFTLQVEVRSRIRQANGGIFFRAIPGDFMNGYEAQIYTRAVGGDVAKPFTWATGALDDRQNARRVVSRDGEFFVMTVIARGPHLATWVNGHAQVDFLDTRSPNENARRGLRLEPGTIQLQAHDAGTDLEFRRVQAAEGK
jgi:enamine deaminase RidA (YjgF/YER057c/UK114 family)